MRKRTLARECALKILYRIEIAKESADSSIQDFWSKSGESVNKDTHEFADFLIKGTVEHITAIDRIISKYADNWNISRMAVIDRNILRMAVYEMLYQEDIPPNVSINYKDLPPDGQAQAAALAGIQIQPPPAQVPQQRTSAPSPGASPINAQTGGRP